MSYCTKCGAKLEENAKFCSSCGAKTAAEQSEAYNVNTEEKINSFVNNFTNTEDTTNEHSQEDISKNKGMAVLAYISILVLIPIFAAKDSKFARFHANQGLILLIVSIAISLISKIIGIFNFWIVGTLFSIAFALIDLLIFALAIIGIVNAAQGKAKELPIVGKFRIL